MNKVFGWNDENATPKALNLRRLMFELLESYSDAVLKIARLEDYEQTLSTASGRDCSYTFVHNDRQHAIQIYQSYDFEDYNGRTNPLKLIARATDPKVQEKLDAVDQIDVRSVYANLTDEIIRIQATM